MINHLRTLLLNEPAVAVRGVSDIYVPPRFGQVSVPAELRTFRDCMFPSGFTLAERVALVDNMMAVAHMGELEPYTLRFDTRVTYRDQTPAQLIDLCRTAVSDRVSVTSLMTRLLRLPLAGTTHSKLFQWDQYASDMTDFFKIWTGADEGLMRIGGLIIAFGYQLERVRRGNV